MAAGVGAGTPVLLKRGQPVSAECHRADLNGQKGKVTAATGSYACARVPGEGPRAFRGWQAGFQARCGQVGAPAEIPARVDRWAIRPRFCGV